MLLLLKTWLKSEKLVFKSNFMSLDFDLYIFNLKSGLYALEFNFKHWRLLQNLYWTFNST